MELFDDVFNPSGVYKTLFFNVKPVLKYPTIVDLKEADANLYDRWRYLAENRYAKRYDNDVLADTVYGNHAVYYPEFTKIAAITYATLYMEDNTLKRFMKKIVDDDEFTVLKTFMDELHAISSEGAQSSPPFFPTLCGHNIKGHDIPHILKKFVLYRDKFKAGDGNSQIPLILKKSLTAKPWESGVIDTVEVWKFGGYEKPPLMLIADYLGLKKVVDLNPLDVVSKKYWETVDELGTDKALEYVSMQSATQTNYVIQIMNELRQL